MSLRLEFARGIGLLAALVVLTGCPPPPGASDENNPLIQEAVGLASTDPTRAIELLEKALGGNPGLARAHRELGNLHYQATHDYAAAIYHFQKYLELDPKSQWRTTIEPQIKQSKIELARSELQAISDASAQRLIQSLLSEKADLTRQLEEANGTIQRLATQLGELTNRVAGATSPELRPGQQETSQPGRTPETSRQPQQPVAAGVATTHQVAPGETLSSIGRAHGFTLGRMKEANPGINHDRLRIGQTINLPRRTDAR
ncbi:MAG: LysM peptidoglycan-binding domain-containing protein [Verrucomicrobiae bacterium]|nr:LysM peptidoglycan-binding domain-containing protein [Verrucomicrobiae bacterium]MCP5524961.1 LysM peptidoglycan-binding domain-containing protein [Verrucomicrobiales bacterium]